MKKVKKPNGTIVEVEDDYELQEGEEFVADEKDPEEEEIKGQLKSYIQKETIDSLERELDKISDSLVNKFFNGVAEQRKKAIDIGRNSVRKEADQEIVRKWFTALLNRDHSTLKMIQKDYLQTDEGSQGGYLVPTPLLAEINRFTEEYGVARRDMRYLPFSGPGNSRNIPALANAVSVYWLGEGAAKTSTKPQFTLVPQVLYKLAAIVPITEEILEDSAIDIIRLLGELFGEAIAREEDRVYLTGDTAAGDPCMGVLNAAGIVPVTMGAGLGVADIHPDDLLNLIYAVPREIRDKGKFYLHSSIFKLIQRAKATDGHYIVQPPTGDKPGTIWNRPYELVDVLPDDTTTGAGVPFMFYTFLGKTCVYGDKAGLKVKLLEEGIVKSAEESPSDLNLATQDMVAFRIVKRTGYVPVLPAGIAVLTTGEES